MALQQYGRWTRTFPYKITVDSVVFTAPNGLRQTQPTFLHQPVTLTYDDHGYEHMEKDGKPLRAVRFTPMIPGMYRYRALAGEEVVEEGGIKVESSDNPGYVHISTQDPRYFAFTDRTSFCPIGLCMAGPPRYPLPKGTAHFETGSAWATMGAAEYERWFRLLAENGGNFARIWLSHPYFNVETETAGELDLAAFGRLDAVIEHARTYDIRLKLCFDHFRTFEPGSFFSKELHHPDDGRTPESFNAWLQAPTWRELWLKKVDAYLDRYGGDPIVMAWELWNEMDCVDGDWEHVLDWTKDMVKTIKERAPEHLVTNSLGSFDDPSKESRQSDFKFFAMDFQQVHRYLDQGAPWEICREDPVAFSLDAVRRARRTAAAILLAETGAVNDRHTGPFRYYRMDNRGIIFNDTTFPSFFAGASGTGQIWHWDRYVDEKNLWRFFKPFAEMLEGVAVDLELFQTADLSHDDAWFLALRGQGHVLAWVRNKADTWHTVLRDGVEPPLLEDQVFDLTALNVTHGRVRLYWPWDDAPPEVEEPLLSEGKLHLPPFRYGLMIKIGP